MSKLTLYAQAFSLILISINLSCQPIREYLSQLSFVNSRANQTAKDDLIEQTYGFKDRSYLRSSEEPDCKNFPSLLEDSLEEIDQDDQTIYFVKGNIKAKHAHIMKHQIRSDMRHQIILSYGQLPNIPHDQSSQYDSYLITLPPEFTLIYRLLSFFNTISSKGPEARYDEVARYNEHVNQSKKMMTDVGQIQVAEVSYHINYHGVRCKVIEKSYQQLNYYESPADQQRAADYKKSKTSTVFMPKSLTIKSDGLFFYHQKHNKHKGIYTLKLSLDQTYEGSLDSQYFKKTYRCISNKPVLATSLSPSLVKSSKFCHEEEVMFPSMTQSSIGDNGEHNLDYVFK